eukprot:gene4638-14973_t
MISRPPTKVQSLHDATQYKLWRKMINFETANPLHIETANHTPRVIVCVPKARQL